MTKDSLPDDQAVGCGISYVWMNHNDRFNAACEWHDAAYEARINGEPTPPLKEVDGMFLSQMKRIASEEPNVLKKSFLYTKAYLYWGFARVWGLTLRRNLWSDEGQKK